MTERLVRTPRGPPIQTRHIFCPELYVGFHLPSSGGFRSFRDYYVGWKGERGNPWPRINSWEKANRFLQILTSRQHRLLCPREEGLRQKPGCAVPRLIGKLEDAWG